MSKTVSQERIQQIIAAMKALYTDKNVNAKNVIVAKEYTKSPLFQDPLVKVYGQDNLTAQFRSISYFFHSVAYEVESYKLEDTVPPKLTIQNQQVYKFKENSDPIKISATTILELVKEEGTEESSLVDEGRWVIGSHTDSWKDNKMLEKIPGYQWLGRPVFGSVSSFFFKLFI